MVVKSYLQYVTTVKEIFDVQKPPTFTVFQNRYLLTFIALLVSDGFRGPFLYPLYKSYDMSNEDIYVLFAVTFFSAAFFCFFFGKMADKW
jgi:MFS family permease